MYVQGPALIRQHGRHPTWSSGRKHHRPSHYARAYTRHRTGKTPIRSQPRRSCRKELRRRSLGSRRPAQTSAKTELNIVIARSMGPPNMNQPGNRIKTFPRNSSLGTLLVPKVRTWTTHQQKAQRKSHLHFWLTLRSPQPQPPPPRRSPYFQQ